MLEDKHIVVTTDVPGLDEKDLDLTVAGDVLTIRGEKKADTTARARPGETHG
jgi:HSP20 family protein